MANKYGNIKGNGFDSRKEANRYAELRLLQRAGKIFDLQRQVEYLLTPGDKSVGIRARKYIADFVYHDENGELVVEDVKGYKKGAAYALFTMKKAVMWDKYQIFVKEI